MTDWRGLPEGVARAVAANQELHSLLADRYDDVEPHFRPENRAKVRRRVIELTSGAPMRRLLDIGCGTGFMISLIGDLFETVDGLDATPAMLARIQSDHPSLTLHEGLAEALPFPDATFDVVTAYSFLDHLADPSLAIAEALRVLKPGGIVYADLLPNRAFWFGIHAVATQSSPDDAWDPIVTREVGELVRHADAIQSTYGAVVEEGTWEQAEPVKADGQGFDARDTAVMLNRLGFTDVHVHHEWFLGEAHIIHGDDPSLAGPIADHLRRLLPVSSDLFKYLWFSARAPGPSSEREKEEASV